MLIRPYRYFEDNYAYTLTLPSSPSPKYLVDPGDTNQFTAMANALEKITVLITHKHNDHTGQMDKLIEGIKPVAVWAGNGEGVFGVTRQFGPEETTFNEGNTKIRVKMSPCHTRHHVLYYIEWMGESTEPQGYLPDEPIFRAKRALFTGDTVFIGGVGKFFEGSAQEMYANLEWVKSLPDDTYIFPGHDYLKGNMKFAQGIEPENKEYSRCLQELEDQAIDGNHSLPSTVGQEKKSNVFFRADLLKDRLGVATGVEALGLLRAMKDQGKSLLAN